MEEPNDRMNGQVCLVTGANSGIGKATVMGLAEMGATVVMVCRNRNKGEAAQAEIKVRSGNDSVDLMVADLSSQRAIRQLAHDFKARYQQLHVLVNNAGGLFGTRSMTEDGLEWTFAVNHLAYFLLTNLLLDVLKASAPARIVNVTSGAQVMGQINFDDLQGEKSYSGQRAYNQSKLANVLFTYELARRLGQATANVTVNCVQPGAVRTNFGRENPTLLMRFMIPLLAPLMRTPEKGAEMVLYLATASEVEGISGKYFVDKKPVKSSKVSYDEAVAQRL